MRRFQMCSRCLPPELSRRIRLPSLARRVQPVMQYNFNIQREFASNVVVTAAYVGARGVHLWREADFNIANSLNPPLDTLFPPVATPVRRNPNFGSIRFKVSDSNSFYNA